MQEKNYTMKDAMIFSQRIAQLSKALWKAAEKDWQQWIKPFDLNINEHHILWIAYHLNGASISDVAKFGVMHVSTAFNFSKKLEERGLLSFSKKEHDKRNTYIQITLEGESILLELMEQYDPANNSVLSGTLPTRELYGKFPDMMEMMAIIRNIYGEDFMGIFERSFDNIDKEFTVEEGKIAKKKSEKETEAV
ncbi:HTH-type transcriptional regulator Hpr [Peribacillus loiseleuriae]|uniref:Transcriptional regulator Hpr n=1 Tax=Peribacillus loiseleuriae TaxID=1679170 RepID=A0A0K9GRZ5_9BACI|nr:HTH-type transcriptional regulator Hpr [Peribacillus loiseleuriae]KMY49017.1 transcriptional regulator Hpr [Peribacillus loiseleuriae]